MAAQVKNYGKSVDIDQWADSLERILVDVPQYMCTMGHPSRISRIPENLREVEAKAYEPQCLSIGPYHHGKPKLQNMEKRKLNLLKYLLELNPELTVKDYLKEIMSIEQEARSFYSEVNMQTEVFLRMLLLDSLCIVTAFCGMPKFGTMINTTNTSAKSEQYNEDTHERMNWINEATQNWDDNESMPLMARIQELSHERSEEEHVDGPRWLWVMFVHDIFLLENQLPFFVLQKVHNLIYSSSETSLIVVLEYEFRKILWQYTRLDSHMVISPAEEVDHLLHLCHMFFQPIHQQESNASQLNESDHMFRLESAVQLYKTGVTFEARSGSTECSLLDITFSNSGKITMPCLYVDDNTESLLRNLLALEQMKYPKLGLNVSAYAVFLLHLITVPDDVQLLRRKGIINHHLSSDKEMVYFINKLSVGLAFDYVEDNYSLKPVFRELRSYSHRRVPRWRAWLKHRYFNNPWTLISLLAASVILLLTGLQTYYTVYSYYYPL